MSTLGDHILDSHDLIDLLSSKFGDKSSNACHSIGTVVIIIIIIDIRYKIIALDADQY